jgi:hypothetical protein
MVSAARIVDSRWAMTIDVRQRAPERRGAGGDAEQQHRRHAAVAPDRHPERNGQGEAAAGDDGQVAACGRSDDAR